MTAAAMISISAIMILLFLVEPVLEVQLVHLILYKHFNRVFIYLLNFLTLVEFALQFFAFLNPLRNAAVDFEKNFGRA